MLGSLYLRRFCISGVPHLEQDDKKIFDINTQFKWELPEVSPIDYPPVPSFCVYVEVSIGITASWHEKIS